MLVLFLKSYFSFPISVVSVDFTNLRIPGSHTKIHTGAYTIRNVTAIVIRSWGKSISDKMVAGDTVYNPVRLLSSSLPPCSLEFLSHRAHGGKRYLKASTCRCAPCVARKLRFEGSSLLLHALVARRRATGSIQGRHCHSTTVSASVASSDKGFLLGLFNFFLLLLFPFFLDLDFEWLWFQIFFFFPLFFKEFF